MSSAMRLFVAPSLAVMAFSAIPVMADEVILASGDTLHGAVIEQTSELLVFNHDVLGRLEIPAKQIQTLVKTDGMAGPYAAAQDVAAGAEAGGAAEDPKEWKSRFELAFGGSFGNTDTQNFRAGVVSKRETDRNRTALDARYFYGADDGDRTDNSFTAGILHDWLMPESRWFWFADGRYDYNEFKSWEHRISAHVGPGYELIKKENFQLNLRAGIGVVKEFGSDNDDFRPEGLFGGDFAWQISDRQSLEGSATIYPDLDDMGEFRSLSRLNWALLVDADSNMSLTAGVEHEYESKVDPGTDEHDLRIFAGLMFDF